MRRHELDVFSLVTGLLFVAVAVGHLLDETSDVTFDGRWVVPLVLVTIGVASLAGVVRGREPGREDAEPARFAAPSAAGSGAIGDEDTDTVVLEGEEPEER